MSALRGMADIGIFSAQVRLLNLDEEIAHAEEQLSKLERDTTRHPSDHPQTCMNMFRPAVPRNRPSLGGRAVRGFRSSGSFR